MLARPDATLSAAVPICLHALVLPARGDQPATLRSLAESELQWWLSVLSYLVRSAGAALLPHMDSLRTVLRLTRSRKERKVNKAACGHQRPKPTPSPPPSPENHRCAPVG